MSQPPTKPYRANPLVLPADWFRVTGGKYGLYPRVALRPVGVAERCGPDSFARREWEKQPRLSPRDLFYVVRQGHEQEDIKAVGLAVADRFARKPSLPAYQIDIGKTGETPRLVYQTDFFRTGFMVEMVAIVPEDRADFTRGTVPVTIKSAGRRWRRDHPQRPPQPKRKRRQ